ncbi:MAG: saccharopine dehydrogenase NADP-binding domain-containing protein [Bacteroidetes bacterium]|nr:saccharopine dehydrogenase NADP-binding domain-containing protein [Bacteroidota bacterium]
MKKILILGAGLSSSSLIKYLLDHSNEHNWKIKVGDVSLSVAKEKIMNHPNGEAFEFDIFNEIQKEEEIKNADAVISMLPARFHPLVAACCLKNKKHMLTASYVSDEMKALNEEAKIAGIAFLNELGVDPGIDHMSAMKVVDKIKADGGKMLSFKSSTGGLIAPEYDNNPWNYKFTWNPRNVVVAGQGVSQYKQNGDIKYLPYHQLFERIETTTVPGLGEFEIYPNRDSLKFRAAYNLLDIPTMFRGTMRRPGYCRAWNVFVQLGMTDDTYVVENSENLSYRQFVNLFLNYDEKHSVEEKIAAKFNISMDSDIMYRLKWLGLFEHTKIGLKDATPAQILQQILVDKWLLGKDDKDLIVMQHQFEYEQSGKKHRITSSLVVIGIDTVQTAMAITVGIPLAIACKLLLTGSINVTGVHTPVKKELYEPILHELESYGIKFNEEEIEL